MGIKARAECCRARTVREIELAATVQAPGQARRFIRDQLPKLGFAKLVDDAVVIVNELVTNGVAYAPWEPITVALRTGEKLILEVWDCSEERPVMQLDSPDATGGRGLRVVKALAVEVGCSVVPGGKCVWAALT